MVEEGYVVEEGSCGDLLEVGFSKVVDSFDVRKYSDFYDECDEEEVRREDCLSRGARNGLEIG